jgi:putative methanogen marker protein 4
MIVGIGVGADAEKVLASVRMVGSRVTVQCYLPHDSPVDDPSLRIVRHERPEEALVADLVEGRIDAAVRGTLPANATLAHLRQAMHVSSLERIALLEVPDGTRFLLAPVGVDEGWTVREKCSLVESARTIAPKFGLNDRVAVLSGGRLGDVGRHAAVDRSLADAELVARITGADHAEILIEEAIRNHGIIIAPDGISGNLIFRTLIFLGGGYGHGAPVVNIDRIFVDTSRASPDYSNALLLAASLVKK